MPLKTVRRPKVRKPVPPEKAELRAFVHQFRNEVNNPLAVIKARVYELRIALAQLECEGAATEEAVSSIEEMVERLVDLADSLKVPKV